MKHVLLFLAFGGLLSAESFQATLVKPVWRDGHGLLEISDQGIAYTAKGAPNGSDWLGLQHTARVFDRLANRPPSLSWTWLDIQYFDRLSRKEFVVVTYKDDWRFLGRDREYRFRLRNGELSDALFQTIGRHLDRPVTDRVPPLKTAGFDYVVPVKLNHTFGGSEGKLEFTDEAIHYVTPNKDDGRTWVINRDIVSVWSSDPYRLEIRAYDNNRREFSRTATYKFDLKRKLDPEFYRRLKLRLYDLEANNAVIR